MAKSAMKALLPCVVLAIIALIGYNSYFIDAQDDRLSDSTERSSADDVQNQSVSSEFDFDDPLSAKIVTEPVPNEIKDSIASGTVIGDRFNDLPVLYTSFRVLTSGRVERVRLMNAEADGLILRVKDELSQSISLNHWEIVRQSAMAANRLLVQGGSEVILDRWQRQLNFQHELVVPYRDAPFHILYIAEASYEQLNQTYEHCLELNTSDVQLEPDYVHWKSAVVADDSDFNQQWSLQANRLDAPEAWEVTTGSENVVVAVIDTGTDMFHPDLRPNLWFNPNELNNGIDDDGNGYVDDFNGWDILRDDNYPQDHSNHGTHLTGIIGAVGNNEEGVAGINWSTRVIPLRVAVDFFPTSSVIEALDYVRFLKVNKGINIVATNNSYHTYDQSELLRDAIIRQKDSGILFVAAAGNLASNNDYNSAAPATLKVDNIISVGGTTEEDGLYSQSNFGRFSVHLGAPATNIYSTLPGGYATGSGTSMAAAHVTGAAALVKSANPDLDYKDIRQIILESGDPISALQGRTVTGRRLNLRRAVEFAAKKPELVITSPVGALVRAPQVGQTVKFSAEADFAMPAAVEEADFSQEWVVVPSDGVVVQDLVDGAAWITFPSAGNYEVSYSYSVDSEISEAAISVVVGDEDWLQGGRYADWSFDLLADSVIPDESDNSRDAMVIGGALETGIVDNALRLNGSTDLVTLENVDLDTFTFSTWIYLDGSGNSIFPRLMETSELIVFLGMNRGGYYAYDQTLRFYIRRTEQDGVWHTEPGVVKIGEWQHIALTYDLTDPDSIPRMFVNGAEEYVVTEAPPRGDRYNDGRQPTIGNSTNGSRALDGLIDEMVIYDSELPSASIRGLASLPSINSVPRVIVDVPPAGYVDNGAELHAEIMDEDSSSDLSLLWEPEVADSCVTFSDSTGLITDVSFCESGEYTLHAIVSDGRSSSLQKFSLPVGAISPVVTVESTVDSVLRSALHPVVFSVSASPAPIAPTQVHFDKTGSAQEGQDYQSLPSVWLDAGESSKDVVLVPITNTNAVAASSLTLSLMDRGAGYVSGDPNQISLQFQSYQWGNWLSAYENQLPEGFRDLSSDYDRDGIPNAWEYIAGTSPVSANSSYLIGDLNSSLHEVDDQSYIKMEFTTNIAVQDLNIGAQFSSDLSAFSDPYEASTVTANLDGSRTYQFIAPLAIDVYPFARIHAELNHENGSN